MFCAKCGKEIMDEAVVCVHCGCSTQLRQTKTVDPSDAPNLGMAIVGFLVPVAGLILWAVNKDTKPQMAKSAGKGALISVIVSTACSILFTILYVLLMIAAVGGAMYY